MDRFDPDNFDPLTHERRTTVRGLEIERFPGGDNPYARGHDFRLGFDVGPNTRYAISANAKELRRWTMLIAEAVTRLDPEPEMCPECGRNAARDGDMVAEHEVDGEPCYGSSFEAEGPTCPACRGHLHIDLSGALWSVTAAASERVRALHRPVEYRPGDHYANYGPPSKRGVLRGADERPEVVTVCEECQAQIDELLLSESGGYGSWKLAEFPCRTILAADGYPESVSWRMAADLWAGIWRSQG